MVGIFRLGPSFQVTEISRLYFLALAVTADNFLFWTVQTGQDIQEYLADAPPCEKVEQGIGNDGTTYPIVKSQPLANGFKWNESLLEITNAGIHLNNFSHGGSESMTAFLVASLRGMI